MPFRSMQTLEAWLDEFRTLGYTIAGSARVMRQDGDSGENTGLVGVRLAGASTVTYIQPETRGAVRWVVVLEPRDDTVTLDAAGLMELANELTVVSALCAFLQAKSASVLADEPDGTAQSD